jgi:hypothetical protein
MFLLYHSEGFNTSGMVFRWCYVNDLHTTPCSGMLGHHKLYQIYVCPNYNDVRIEEGENKIWRFTGMYVW